MTRELEMRAVPYVERTKLREMPSWQSDTMDFRTSRLANCAHARVMRMRMHRRDYVHGQRTNQGGGLGEGCLQTTGGCVYHVEFCPPPDLHLRSTDAKMFLGRVQKTASECVNATCDSYNMVSACLLRYPPRLSHP